MATIQPILIEKPELIDKLTGCIANGMYLKVAASVCGISEKSLYNWMTQGKTDLEAMETNGGYSLEAASPYCRLYVQSKEAESKAIQYRWDKITEIGEGGKVLERTITTNRQGEETIREKFSAPTFQPFAWELERRWNNLFGDKQTLEVTGQGGGPIKMEGIIFRTVEEANKDYQLEPSVDAEVKELESGDQTSQDG